ncbi:MAG: hypothetical protein NTU44_00150 [Bacteroidetes bacterium]|nr:hypothetical protein [Bacteroidota bacterium]
MGDLSAYTYKSNWVQFHYIFNTINLFYKSFRQGINEKGESKCEIISEDPKILGIARSDNFYFKPLIFLYAKEVLQKQWDKKTIKEKYLNVEKIKRRPDKTECNKYELDKKIDRIEEDGLITQQSKRPNSDILNFIETTNATGIKYDIKDLFGLSSLENWKSYDAIISKENEDIARFKSPLFFKPYHISGDSYRIYFDFDEIPKEYTGKTFSVKFNGKGNLLLVIPDSFNWTDFFNYVFNINNFNVEKHVIPLHKSYEKFEKWLDEKIYKINYYQTLKSIYQQLQGQQ